MLVITEKKSEGLKRINMGEWIINIAWDLGGGETTVGEWKCNKKQVGEYYASVLKYTLENWATHRELTHDHLSEPIFLCFKQYRAQDVLISGLYYKKRHFMFNEKLNGLETFLPIKVD